MLLNQTVQILRKVSTFYPVLLLSMAGRMKRD